ncbi:hypothetical protein CPB84DRAFT_1778730 [Gymnopilus junonius]|uniref:Uncharacterized protein n=1 Tax=Gymnopilus junonius TaxID=109634 RepID=A0A9P5TN26_GYMJU|nr:hypothetical protein CPB84DRAFT_1778730 [Gymnopilus junonius]
MSDTAKVRAIREYITKVDKGDIPGANIFVAQNFSYNHTASGGAAAYSAGKTLTKDQVNEVQAALQNNFKAIKTEIESITENGGKVQVRAKTTFELKVK